MPSTTEQGTRILDDTMPPGATHAEWIAPFSGAKAALLCGTGLVVLRRDDVTSIPFPGQIDLPGGGRDPGETPSACAVREIREEVSLVLPKTRFHWARRYPRADGQAGYSWFLAAQISEAEAQEIAIGDEGQACWLMEVEAFLRDPDAIDHLQARLRDYLAATG